jgi:hypothetical protein
MDVMGGAMGATPPQPRLLKDGTVLLPSPAQQVTSYIYISKEG